VKAGSLVAMRYCVLLPSESALTHKHSGAYEGRTESALMSRADMARQEPPQDLLPRHPSLETASRSIGLRIAVCRR
jgi:hypothetical protein